MTRKEAEQRVKDLRRQLAMYHAFRDGGAIAAVEREIELLTQGTAS